MKKICMGLLAVLCTVGVGAKPQKIGKLTVTVSAEGRQRNGTIASLNLSGYDAPTHMTVTDQASGRVCASQLDVRGDGTKTLYWLIADGMSADESRRYVVTFAPATGSEPYMSIETGKEGLTVREGGRNVFRYNTAMSKLPHGVDKAFSRNGYIHPAWSPRGNVLTNLSPDDHMHHYGIWNPWTLIEYDGQTYDLWNLGSKLGTVHGDSICSTASGDLFAEVLARHRHIIFQPQTEQVMNNVNAIVKITPKKRMVIMDELLGMRAWRYGGDRFVWDFNSELIPCTSLPVLLKAYRYAGFGWRATADWTKENCEMYTSEGKTRSAIDGTNARWIYVTGQSPNGKSGILFLASPGNRNFPEPLRIWDERANGGRGDAFINFAPSKNEDWNLEAGKKYSLRYRIVTFDGDMTPAQAEILWNDYASPVKVSVD